MGRPLTFLHLYDSVDLPAMRDAVALLEAEPDPPSGARAARLMSAFERERDDVILGPAFPCPRGAPNPAGRRIYSRRNDIHRMTRRTAAHTG
jgi:hypothetical protein